MSGFEIALSGLSAASKRVAVASNNLANQFSTSQRVNGDVVKAPYQPQVVEQSSQAVGGVDARITTDGRAPLKAFDPGNPDADDNGFVNFPNVDTAEELINMQVASYDFKANLKSIKVQDDMLQNLLDIKA